MALNPPRTLRTIHNGSNGVAKVSLSVPAGADLTVSAEVADQLQRDPAFKDGAAPQALLDALNPEPVGDHGPEVVTPSAPAKVKPAAKKATPAPKDSAPDA